MIKLTLRKWYHEEGTMVADYHRLPITVKIQENTAKLCMRTVAEMRMSNDLTRFTPWQIIDVDDGQG